MTEAKWTNGKSTRTGCFEYQWASDTFYVHLDKPVGYGGEMLKRLTLLGYETPEWGKWKLVR